MRKLMVFLFFLISFSFSATYYINVTGSDATGDGSETNPWATMSKAQNSSSNGDTVIWQNGSYLSPGASTFTTTMYITKRLYIRGEDCTHPENVVVRMSAATINSVFDVAATASGGSIGCMNLIGTGTQGDNVTGHMYLRTFLGNFTIHDIVLKDLNESASNYAIAFDSTSATNNITIINFTITNVSDVGIHVQTNAGPKNITIANGNFTMGDGTSTDYGIQFANGAPTSNAGPYLFENLTFTCSANCRNTFSTAMLLQGATSEVSNRDLLARNIQIGSQSNPWIGQALRVNRPFNHTYVNVSIFVNTSGTTARVPVQFDTTSNYVTFENCSFGNSTSYIEVANANNIVFDDGNNTVFYNNEIWLDSAADILFLQHADHNVSNPRIDSNRVYLRNGTNMAHFGCGSEGGDSNITDTTNCTIQHNTITYLTNITGVAHSIFFGSTNNSLMYNNTIIGGYYGFLSKGNANMMIRANRGYNQTQVCIYDKGGNNNTYRDNYCYKNETQYESDSQIVLIDGSSVSLPSRNLSFFNNTYNISSPASNITAMYILNPSTSNRIQSNFNTFQVENCTWGMFYNNTPRYNYSQWQTYSGLETDSTFVCPLTITLVNPSNSSNFSSNNISLDFDINGFGTDICKYSLDGGANVSLPTCQNTTLAPGFGKHYLQLHLNNTALQTASSLVHNFTIDVYTPLLSVQSPTNNSNFTGSVAFNYVVSENLTSATCSYSLDGSANVTLSSCANTTKSPTEGRHTIIFFANDTVGNLNVSTQINFTVDSTAPTLSVESPINNTQYNTSSVDFNFTVSDPLFGVETCVYSLNGAANTSLSSCANTTLTLADGVYNVTFYSNDTGGNLRINGVYFFNVSAPSSSSSSSSSDDEGDEIRSQEVSVGIEFTDELLRISVELDGEPTEADISLLLVDPYSGEVFEGSTDRNGVLEVPLSELEFGSYEAVVRVRGHAPVTEEFEYTQPVQPGPLVSTVQWDCTQNLLLVVVTSDGAAVENAEVAILDSLGGISVQFTDAQGRATFSSFMGSPTTYTVSKEGFDMLEGVVAANSCYTYEILPVCQDYGSSIKVRVTTVEDEGVEGALVTLTPRYVLTGDKKKDAELLKSVGYATVSMPTNDNGDAIFSYLPNNPQKQTGDSKDMLITFNNYQATAIVVPSEIIRQQCTKRISYLAKVDCPARTAQITLKDSKTDVGVPYVTVTLAGQTSYADSQGVALFSIDQFTEPYVLEASTYGYAPLKIEATKLPSALRSCISEVFEYDFGVPLEDTPLGEEPLPVEECNEYQVTFPNEVPVGGEVSFEVSCDNTPVASGSISVRSDDGVSIKTLKVVNGIAKGTFTVGTYNVSYIQLDKVQSAGSLKIGALKNVSKDNSWDAYLLPLVFLLVLLLILAALYLHFTNNKNKGKK